MKLSILLLLTLGFQILHAQSNFQPVVRKEIEEAVTNPALATHYPKLLARLQANDTTLGLNDYRLLYYGFAFQPAYSPYHIEKQDEMKQAFEKKDFELVLKYCNESLLVNPATLKTYYYKLIALSKLDKQTDSSFIQARSQYSRFLDAIVSSGNGLSCETAFKVIAVSDEYEVMYRYFQIKDVLSQSLQTPCDKIHISTSAFFAKEYMFFDVSESLTHLQNLFDKKN